jgi:hypothetical protein
MQGPEKDAPFSHHDRDRLSIGADLQEYFPASPLVSDNVATSDGPSSLHSSVADSTGVNVYEKLTEYTNGEGAAAAGVTVSLWKSDIASALTGGASTVTCTFASSIAERAIALHAFSTGSGGLVLDGSPAYLATDASNGFGSSSLSGFSSHERLWFRLMGKEVNTTVLLTQTVGFSTTSSVRSLNNADAVRMWGEFKISTSTGETSNPTLAVSGDTASVFVALAETGTLSASTARPVVFICT